MGDSTLPKPSKLHWMTVVTIGVVVVIIGTAMFAVFNLLGPHKPLRPLAAAYALESGIINFYTEYGDLPHVGNQVSTDSPEGIKLLAILLGLERNAGNHENLRDIKLLNVKEGRDKRNGLIYNATGTAIEGLYDPWGNPYNLVLGNRNEERLQFSIGTQTFDLKGRWTAVFSAGPDKKLGTNDDIRTW